MIVLLQAGLAVLGKVSKTRRKKDSEHVLGEGEILDFVPCVLLQFVCVESMVTALIDMFPGVFRKKGRRELLILAIAVICYLLGLLLVTEVREVDVLQPCTRNPA